jgi:hypothetical protein
MKLYRTILAGLILLIFTTSFYAIEPKEIVAKHLDSIASADKRAQLNTLFAMGASEFEASNPVVKGGGKAIVVSDPGNLYFLMSLNSRDYPFEKIGMFGDKVSLPYIAPGRRSPLGSFLVDNSRILSDGLFCGGMSLRWMTRIADTDRLKWKVTGQKKINGRNTYVIEVPIAGGDSSNFSARLYFDSENFHLVRGEYHKEVDIGGITFRQQNQLANACADLTEDFSEFKEVDGFTFPYIYKATLKSNTPTSTLVMSWTVKVSQYYLNQKLESNFFTFETE